MQLYWIVLLSCAQAAKFIKPFSSVSWSQSNNLTYLTFKTVTCSRDSVFVELLFVFNSAEYY
jgi:hypothetical protein